MSLSEEEWSQLSAAFKEAETALFEAEQVCNHLVIPSVNELRYAGSHMLCAALEENSGTARESFRKALAHCQRATYDAYDSIIVYLLGQIDTFKGDYRTVPIVPHFANYELLRTRAREAKDMLDTARANHDSRETYYTACKKIYPDLQKYCEQMEDAREELNKAVKVHNRGIRNTWVSISVTVIIGAVSIFIAILK
ncbi:MAG: hypothetical protein ABT940_09080 [Alphaproteobacteria bacterium]